MQKEFNYGDKVYHRNLKLYGTFVGYAGNLMMNATWILKWKMVKLNSAM